MGVKTIEGIKQNILEDIRKTDNRKIEEIYASLKKTLNKFDRDFLGKNVKDFLRAIFKTKRERCIQFVEDLFDSQSQLTSQEKNDLRRALLDISNIHRSIIENIIALLGAT